MNNKDLGLDALSSLTVFTKYAKYIPELKRREKWEEIVARYQQMMIKKYPLLEEKIMERSQLIIQKKVLPSMRALQFAGAAMEVNNARGYNCFSKDTKFITSEGVKSFEDFKDGEKTVVLTHKGNWKKAVVKNYGKQELNKITFVRCKSEKTIRATSNHRWILKNGSETTSLKEKDILYKAPDFITDFVWEDATVWEKLAWCYGYVYGDGTKTKNSNGEYSGSMVRLCGNQTKFLYRFTEMGFKNSSSMSLNGDVMVYTGKYLKTTPELNQDTFEETRAFVIGYLDADGGKQRHTTHSSLYTGIQSSQEDHTAFIEKAFEMVSMYITNVMDLTGKETNFGIRPTTKKFGMSHTIGSGPNNHWSVKKIEKDVEEEVWCLEVEDDHSFVLSGGIVTGNCSYLPIDSVYSFSETMFLLLGGSGVGYSVQKQHVAELPTIAKPGKSRNYLIEDSIMGWADAVKVLMRAYLEGKFMPKFDFRAIRQKGARLVTAGGKAPGPEPLKLCLAHIQAILDRKKEGEKLTPLECHDILCHIANSVLAGGIRRSAMIALFSHDDEEMITCKYGNWWETNEQRGRANNSAVLKRGEIAKEEFDSLWKRIEASGSGEPGIYWTNDLDWGTNPCVEIGLRPYQFCNLCEVNVSDIQSQEDLNDRVSAAAFFGTLQASFTNFHYLRPIWQKTTQKDALLGIGMTGIGSGEILKYNLEEAAEVAKSTNAVTSDIIGINAAARITCIKPSGTTSLVLGTASGIHAWHAPYYLRTMRFGKNEDIAHYLTVKHPELCEDDVLRPHDTLCVRIPVKAPEGSIYRTETALDTLERVKKFSKEWVKSGHVDGENTHNISATISIKNDEWSTVGNWMWSNSEFYNGLSVLPYWDHTYAQAPFEDITKEEYDKRVASLKRIDLSKVVEFDDTVDFGQVAACSGAQCEINL